MELQRGMRGKLSDYFDCQKDIDVLLLIDGDSEYDITCFGLDEQDKLSDDRYMIFYNQTASPQNEVKYHQEKDGIRFQVNVSKLPETIKKLVFTVSIDGTGIMHTIQSHTFDILQNGDKKLHLELTGNDFQNEKAIITAELYNKGGIWRFAAIAHGFDGGLAKLLESFGGEEAKDSDFVSSQPVQTAPKVVVEVDTVNIKATTKHETEESKLKMKQKNVVTVQYDHEALKTNIFINSKQFDTARLDGMKIEEWAYPFMVRKVRWDGFYDEMVKALNGEKAFDLVFEGSKEALAELKEAWEDAPINVVSGEQKNTVTIVYDEDTLKTEITINDQVFNTSSINGKEIEDWVYPFMMRKVKWKGIFDELKAALGTDEYEILFSGTRAAMKVLMEECPETVAISYQKSENSVQNRKSNTSKSVQLSNKTTKSLEYSSEQYDSDKVNELWKTEEYETALAIIRPAAESGNIEAQGDLGLAYQLGFGVAVNMSESLNWFLKAAQQGDESSMESVACIYAGIYDDCESLKDSKKAEEWFKKAEATATDEDDFSYWHYYDFLNDEGREKEALAVMKRGADNGSVISMVDLANVFYWGEDYGVSQDFEEAGKWFEKAADCGDNVAMMRMGEFCLYAKGNIPEDNDRAFQYLTKALEQDDDLPFAHLLLGKCYLNGWGTAESIGKAKEHFKKATNADSVEAMFCLGVAYRDEGNGKEATKWLQKAADNDYVDGLVALGYMYLNGNAVKQNYQRAFEFFKMAAIQDNAQAQCMIGQMYDEGIHVQQNYAKANNWYRKAMNNGDIDAKALLGINYFCGNGSTDQESYGAQLIEEAAEEGSEYAQEFIEAYGKSNNGAVKANINKFMTTANDFIKSDEGQKVLKKAGKGALTGALNGMRVGGIPGAALGGLKGAISGIIVSAFDDDEE